MHHAKEPGLVPVWPLHLLCTITGGMRVQAGGRFPSRPQGLLDGYEYVLGVTGVSCLSYRRTKESWFVKCLQYTA